MRHYSLLRICQYSTGIFFLLTLLFSGATFAQTTPTIGPSLLNCDISNRNPCTSKDLEIVRVFVDAPACASCTTGLSTTLPLKMTIHNGTKSERTSFALYGTLSTGASINGQSGEIFVCVGPITVKSDQLLNGETAPGNQTFLVGNITFICGQNLTLSDNFLAWTDAAGTTAARCSTFSQATKCSDIAPKCGTALSIAIVGPVVPPTLAKVDPTCTTSTGTVTVTSATADHTFSLDGAEPFVAYPTGGWSGLASGQHCVRSKRTFDGCISTATCITIPAAPANPARPVVTLQEATICGTVTTPTCTVSCPVIGTYKLTQPNETDQTINYTGTGTVSFSVKPGKGFSVTVNSNGCISDATTCNNYTSNSCPTVNESTLEPVVSSTVQSFIKVAPNPYNDRLRFTFQASESGKASLELYSIMGQKLQTVFEGHIEKGQTKYIDYSVPFAQRAMMVYVFRQGNQKTAGKLVSSR